MPTARSPDKAGVAAAITRLVRQSGQDDAVATDDLVLVRPEGGVGMRLTKPERQAAERYLEGLLPPRTALAGASPMAAS